MPIQLYLPETRYAVVSLPLSMFDEAAAGLHLAEDFVSLTRDKLEVTIIIDENAWREMAPRFSDARVEINRRMIRFDTVLDFSVVGFISEISRALADADISILSVSTFSTDSVLVHEIHFDEAVIAVKQALVALSFTRLAQH